MPQILTQNQHLEQQQRLSAQQVLAARLTELSVEELRARIETECEDNPWLERKDDFVEGSSSTDAGNYDGEGQDATGGMGDDSSNTAGDGSTGDYDGDYDSDASDSSYSNGSESFDDTDNWEATATHNAYPDDARSHDSGDSLSSLDLLMQQVGEYDLDERQRLLLEFLIGSLDGDGMLRTPLYQLADELDINQGVLTNEDELHSLLLILQQFEPAGIGATNLIECLYLQVQRDEKLPMRRHLLTMFEQMSDEFAHKRWDVIQRRLHLNDSEMQALKRSILRLNPRPGGSMGSADAEASHAIVPDFVVDVDDYGEVHFRLCEEGVPVLQMSEDMNEWMDAYSTQDEGQMKRDVIEALRYQRNLMERGNMFIEALAQRRRSLIGTMKAIIKLQTPFFRDGDEASLRPMRMEDAAQIAGVDISTVSRVCQAKTVRTPYGTYPLRWFFTSGTTQDGDEFSVRRILSALRKLVDEEDKRNPLSDNTLTDILQKQGFDVARRTVAKYREQLGIPNSRMRR